MHDAQKYAVYMEKVQHINATLKNKHLQQFIHQIPSRKVHGLHAIDLQNRDQLRDLYSRLQFVRNKKRLKIMLRDFVCLKLLGKGAFGRVYKVIHKRLNKVFAMKVLNKKQIIESEQIKYSLIEKNILQENDAGKFLLSLHFAFQTKNYLYLVIDYCPNGDINILLAQQNRGFFDEKTLKFYICELIVALEDLHARNYIYRDLKPENILIDTQGHVKLADFGLSSEKLTPQKNYALSFCGSPIYLSPEILQQQRTFKESDLYTLGVIIYELLTGSPPYYTESINQLYDDIQNKEVSFDDAQISEEAKDLITQLMRKKREERLGFNGI